MALLDNPVFRFIDFIALVLTHIREFPDFLLRLLDLCLKLDDLDVRLGIANSGASSSGRCLPCFD